MSKTKPLSRCQSPLILEKSGYDVVTACSGEKAVQAVESDPEISLILMDIDLGKGISGTEAAERILEKHDLADCLSLIPHRTGGG